METSSLMSNQAFTPVFKAGAVGKPSYFLVIESRSALRIGMSVIGDNLAAVGS